MASLPDSRTKDKAKELRKQVENDLETLAKAVDAVRASEVFRRYLDFQARFHDYSWHNCMLIMSQRPDASRVAGYRTWQKLGRQVCKGERGIMIFAPRPFKREVERANGETEELDGISFRAVHVFDIGQTDGEELPTVDVPDVDVAADELLAKLECVASNRGHTVKLERIETSEYGSASRDGTIAVDNSHATGQQAKTLAHELAHQTLHFGKTDQATRLTHSIAELEAESVAYVVCKRFGLDVGVRSSRYIALWDGDSKALRASLERIAKTARGIVDDVDGLASRKAVA